MSGGMNYVVKLSGKALGAKAELSDLFRAARGHRLVTVHGGGAEVDSLFAALNLKVEKVGGLRVSPHEQMPYISAALSGMCGKSLQGSAIAAGLNAVSLLCADGGSLKVRPAAAELGMVGQVEPGDPAFLNLLLDQGLCPVIASLAFDAQGELYNVNADDAAAALALTLRAPLYMISDVPGVLDGDGKIIPELTAAGADRLTAQGVISGGMAVKVRSAFMTAQASGRDVFIASWRDPALVTVFDGAGIGTRCLAHA